MTALYTDLAWLIFAAIATAATITALTGTRR